MLRTLTIKLSKSRLIKNADSFIGKYKKLSSGVPILNSVQPVKSVNGQYRYITILVLQSLFLNKPQLPQIRYYDKF